MNNQEVERVMTEYPDKVADLLLIWKKAEAYREQIEGKRHLILKAEASASGRHVTTDDLRAMVKADDERFAATMSEISAEAEYQRAYELLMSAKRIAGLRTAY